MTPLPDLSFDFLRRQKLRQQKDYRGQEALGGVIKKRVLPAIGAVSIGADDRLGEYLRILLRLGFCCNIPGIFHRDIHVLIDQGEEVVAVRPCGVAQIDHRHLIPIALRGNGSIVPGEVPLRIQRQKAHSAGTREFEIRV